MLNREELRQCLFSLQACGKREISSGILRVGWKTGSCQEEREHRLASLPRQTQNLIATGEAGVSSQLGSFPFKKRGKQFEPSPSIQFSETTHLFVWLKPEHLMFPRRLHLSVIEERVEQSTGPITR